MTKAKTSGDRGFLLCRVGEKPLLFYKAPSAVILSVTKPQRESVKRWDLAAVKSDGTPHPSATPPPSPNADAMGRQNIDFLALPQHPP